MFIKIGYSEKFRKFHSKTPVLEFLFNKVAGPNVCNSIKKRLQHKCFPVKFEKFLLRAPTFIEHLRWLFLKVMNSSSHMKVLRIVATK